MFRSLKSMESRMDLVLGGRLGRVGGSSCQVVPPGTGRWWRMRAWCPGRDTPISDSVLPVRAAHASWLTRPLATNVGRYWGRFRLSNQSLSGPWSAICNLPSLGLQWKDRRYYNYIILCKTNITTN